MVLKKGIKKCLCFILSSVMVVGMLTTFNLSVFAADTDENNGDLVNYMEDGLDSEGRMISNFGSPVIDGEVDDVWNDAITVVPKCVTGDVYAEATFKSLWDDNALYILAEVTDRYMSVQSRNPYEQDSLEIFVDENNEKTKDYGVDDLHLRVNYENVQTLDNGDAERFFTSTKLIDGGYLVEARVQLKDKPSNGKVLGLELQINDGVGASRVGTINLFDSTNGAWNDTGKFGEVILLGKTEGAITGLNPYNLKNLIIKTKKLDFTRYTNASIVTDAIENAEEVLADKNTTQDQIDEQYDAVKSAISKLKLTKEAANEKEFIALPDEYRLDNVKHGTIERLSYNYADADDGTIVKDVNIYLPYGYDPSNKSKKYNVLYLMHGGGENVNTIFGGPGESKELMKILDNMIAKGDIEPLIVVTPSFYGGKNDGNVALFHEELTSEIIPLVETKYNTYLRSTSLQDMKTSREHRAFGGFSMGSMTTWNVFANCLDYVKYYMPLCAGFRFQAQNPDEQSSAEFLASVAKKSGYKVPEDFKIFAASGSADIAHPGMEPQMNEMRELTDTFIYSSNTQKGNLYFIVCDGGTHAWGYVNQYIYNILPDLFDYTPAPSTNTNSGSSSSSRKSKSNTPAVTATPTATPIVTSTSVPDVTPTPDTVVEQKETIPAAVYSDISNHWAKDFINDLISKNILSGYQDGTIKPDKNISRAELTTIVAKAMGLKPVENPVLDFADKANIPSWAAGYIAVAKEKGIVLGYNDKTFGPNKNCTRQEAVTIIMNAFKLGESDNKLTFKDEKEISSWAYKSVAKFTESKIIDGYPDNTFKPGNNITRAEVFSVLSKCLNTK